MITDTEINELEPANFHWEPARFATDTCRKINEEHGGYADCKIISTTNISDISKTKGHRVMGLWINMHTLELTNGIHTSTAFNGGSTPACSSS